MIYAIDNGLPYSFVDYRIWFVESDAGFFGAWWRDVFAPWLVRNGHTHKILFTAEEVTWWKGGALTTDEFFESVHWYEEDLTTGEPLPRPIYVPRAPVGAGR